MRHTVRRALVAATSALTLAGCGTTVSGTTTTDASLSAPGSSGSQNAAAAPPSGLSAVVAGTATGAAAPTGPAGLPDATHTLPAAVTGQVAPDGPGVSRTTITLGISYYQSAKEANAALGARGVDTGDPVATSRVLIHAINEAGGIAGRHVVPLFYAVDPQSAQPYASEAQAECSYFAEDHHVFAVLDGTPAADARACLAKHGVAVLRGSLITGDLTGNEIDAYSSTMIRTFAALVPSLSQQGWFSPWNRLTAGAGTARAKVGIVTGDDADSQRAIKGVLLPALQRAGYSPNSADVIWINEPQGFSDDGATVAAIDNAVLKLNADGVDHVILNDSNGSLSLLFNSYAYSQNYFPRYGGTSGNAWQVLLTAGDLQAKTLQGAMGVGWQPLFDVPFTNGDGPRSNAARHRCFQIFARAGIHPTDGATAGSYAEGCDVAFLLPAALRGYAGALNLGTVMQRVDALAQGYPLASAFSGRFGPDQHDGNGSFTPMHFDPGCGCVAYGGATQPMPR